MITMAYKILDFIGYYRIKKNVKHRAFCRKLQKEDALRKQEVRKAVEAMQGGQLKKNGDASDIIVSLTSYGVRVEDTLPYALYSLLRQTHMPNRIVVWLDNINWDEEKLPPVLKKLQSLGVEFYFVEDLRSYKKLIPALKRFPHNTIITVDDDMYYNRQLIEWLVDAYNEYDEKCVLGPWGVVEAKEDGVYLPYSQWKDKVVHGSIPKFSLIGCGGILYPPDVFDDEILKEDVFMKLAPSADDLWFWAMEKRQGVPVNVTPNARYGLHTPVNRVDAWEPNREGSLYFINEINGENDEQLFRLIKYYSIIPDQD